MIGLWVVAELLAAGEPVEEYSETFVLLGLEIDERAGTYTGSVTIDDSEHIGIWFRSDGGE